MRINRARINDDRLFGFNDDYRGGLSSHSAIHSLAPHRQAVDGSGSSAIAAGPAARAAPDIGISGLGADSGVTNYRGPQTSDHSAPDVAGLSANSLSALGDHYWQGIAPGSETTDAVETTATTYSMVVGQSFYGTITDTDDDDWIAITLTAGVTYDIRLLGMGAGFLTDPLVRIYDSAGLELVSNDDGFGTTGADAHGLDSRLVYTATTTGTYYVAAEGYSNRVGDYLLSATVQDPAGMVFTADEIAWQLINSGWSFFGGAQGAHFNVGVDSSLTVNITALTAEGQFLAREAMMAWSSVTNITFVETAGAAEITFDDNQAGAFANPTSSGGIIVSSIVNVGLDWLSEFGTTLNSYSFETYIHEIGHALGLAHGGNYNGSANYGEDNYYLNDGLAWSIMSYMQAENDEFDFGGASDWNTFLDASFRYMVTPMIADIIAIQYLYGVSSEFTGNTTWGFGGNTGVTALDTAVDQGALMAMTVYDTGGVDTLNFSLTSAAQIISLAAESMSSVLGGRHNLSIARGVTIENAVGGAGVDVITGNAVANKLDGGGGADVLIGGLGDDTYVVNNAADVVTELKNEGTDTVRSSVTFSLYGGYVENLTLSGTGNTNGTGNGSNNTITGNAGNNVINGGKGADAMIGGAGGDTYHVDDLGDTVVEANVTGVDTVNSSVTFSIYGGYVENLNLTGSAAINGTGNGSNNTITGNSAANVINGGKGADAMIGGAGGDTYHVDDLGDTVVEANVTGVDTVNSSVTFSIYGGYVENLNLTGSAAINGTGNGSNNTIIGNAAANVITGGGGADTLTGGLGVDTFVYTATSQSATATGIDRIVDLTNTDVIDLSAIDARSNVAGNNAFSLVSAFTGVSGQMTISYNASSNATSILMDTNGDSVADMKIVLTGDHDDFTNFVF